MYNEIYEKIKEYETIVVARHIGVDPDALCSQLAMRESIRLTFPEKKVYAIGTGSQKFLQIGKLDKIENFEDALLIVCDTPDLKRIDGARPEDYKFTIKIDHHPFIDSFGGIELIEDDKTSACEIIMKLIEDTPLKCNKEIAEYLYMGLASDSNRFLFNSTTAKTFKIVADYMYKYNFNLEELYNKLYLRPLSEVRLEGYISLNMKVTENGLGYIVITDDIIKEYGVDSASAGNMINDFNYIKEVIVWATITEDKKNNLYRVSIRSRGPKINKIAEAHNGGGHSMASGARVQTINDALLIMKDLDEELKKYNKEVA